MTLLVRTPFSVAWTGFEPASPCLDSKWWSNAFPLGQFGHVSSPRHLDISCNSFPYIIALEKEVPRPGLEPATLWSAVEWLTTTLYVSMLLKPFLASVLTESVLVQWLGCYSRSYEDPNGPSIKVEQESTIGLNSILVCWSMEFLFVELLPHMGNAEGLSHVARWYYLRLLRPLGWLFYDMDFMRDGLSSFIKSHRVFI